MRGSMKERSPGVWLLRAYLGRDSHGRVKHAAKTFRGGKRAAERELARLVAEQTALQAAKARGRGTGLGCGNHDQQRHRGLESEWVAGPQSRYRPWVRRGLAAIRARRHRAPHDRLVQSVAMPVTAVNTTVPLPLDTDPIRRALNSPDPAIALAVAIVAFHAFTAALFAHPGPSRPRSTRAIGVYPVGQESV